MSHVALCMEVARTLQVQPDTVRQWLADGTLDAVLVPDASPWIHCFPARSRLMHLLRQSKKRHSAHLSTGQSRRISKDC